MKDLTTEEKRNQTIASTLARSLRNLLSGTHPLPDTVPVVEPLLLDHPDGGAGVGYNQAVDEIWHSLNVVADSDEVEMILGFAKAKTITVSSPVIGENRTAMSVERDGVEDYAIYLLTDPLTSAPEKKKAPAKRATAKRKQHRYRTAKK